ncbi:MAG: hypothetical protein H6651_03500 [Ardenticatenales bacterium]|nr:hypothetical protein [Ardenticatenales bacterium]
MRQLFKHKVFAAILGFVLLMATLACTCSALPFLDEEGAEETVEATVESGSGEDVAEPTTAAVAESDGTFVAASDADSGIALEHPGDWVAVQEFGFQLYSDASLEDAQQIGDGAGVFVFGGFPADAPPLETVESFLENDNDFENVEVLSGPESLTINGNEAAQMVVQAEVDGEAVQMVVTVISTADNSATVLAMSSVDTADDFRPIFDQIINSIVLSTPEFSLDIPTVEVPTVEVPDVTTPEPTTESSSGGNLGGLGQAGGAALVLDKVFAGPATSSQPASFTFPALAGRAVVIMALSPAETDLTLRIFDPQGNEMEYIDSHFGETAEYYLLDPAADGEYRIEVAPYSGEGNFMIGVLGLADDAPGILLTDADTTANGAIEYTLTSGGDGAFLIYMDVEDEADLTLTLLDADGNQVAYVDGGFSGEPEVLFYATSGIADYTLVVDDYSSGSYEIYIGGAELVGPPPVGGDNGNGGSSGSAGGDGSAIAASDAFNTDYPVIDGATDFIEIGTGINYSIANVSLSEVAEFYRYQASLLGLTERTVTTFISDDVVNLVFDGADEGALVVQAVPLGGGVINVNVRYEDV